jgi:hypothetical protein
MLLPFFRNTVAIARQEEVPAEVLAWLRGLLVNPFWVRNLAAHVQAAIVAPGVLPPAQLMGLRMLAQQFGAHEELPAGEPVMAAGGS